MISAVQHLLYEAPSAISQIFYLFAQFVNKPLFPHRSQKKLGSSAEPMQLQRLLFTLSQHSPVRRGSFYTKHTIEETHMRSLKGAVNSLPSFMKRVPQTWQAYILAGIVLHLANQRRACGLSIK